MCYSSDRRISGVGGRPSIRAGIVFPAGVQIVARTIERISTPNDHFTASPHRRVILSANGRVDRGGGRPAIRAGIISPAAIEIVAEVAAAPDDHFTAGPHCRVTESGDGCVDRAGGG